MAKIYKSVEELIGNTPLLELTKIEKETGATLLAKVEALNPGGSAKDRIAKRMVEDAEKAGILKEGATIIEYISSITRPCGNLSSPTGHCIPSFRSRNPTGQHHCRTMPLLQTHQCHRRDSHRTPSSPELYYC